MNALQIFTSKKVRDNSGNSNQKCVDPVNNLCGALNDAFGPNESEFVRRVQFTLDGNMRPIVEGLMSRMKYPTLNEAFKSSLSLLYHFVFTGTQCTDVVLEKSNGLLENLNILAIFKYIDLLKDDNKSSGKYQISLDEKQTEILDALRTKLGLASNSDVFRQALIVLYGVSCQAAPGDKIIFQDDNCDYTVELD